MYRLGRSIPIPPRGRCLGRDTHGSRKMPAQLGVDAGRIGGGRRQRRRMLAAIVTQAARDKGGLKIAYQLLMFPHTQMGGRLIAERIRGGLFPERRAIEYFTCAVPAAGRRPQFPKVSPLARQGFRRPAARLCDAGAMTRCMTKAWPYAEKLPRRGEVTLADYGRLVHGFIYLQTVLPRPMMRWPRRRKR